MDALSFHPYPGTADTGPGSAYQREWTDVHEAEAKWNDTSRRLWITETGFPSDGVGNHDQDQSQVLQALYNDIATRGDVDLLTFYSLTQQAVGSDPNFGVVTFPTPLLQPRPAYCALAGLRGMSPPECA